MPNRTIAKFLVFVILASIAGAAGSCANSLHPGRDSGRFSSENSSFDPPRLIGKLASADILESSGLAVSKCQQNVFWTHNDSGDDAFIYAFAGDGKHLGTWRVTGAVNRDWEDMASTKDADGCYLYIGDIGDNGNVRGQGTIYRIREPLVVPDAAATFKKNALNTEAAEVLNFRYELKHDAETLMVNPNTGDLYILTKRGEGPAVVFKLKPLFGPQPVLAEKVGEVRVPSVPDGLITGGDIALDGTRAALCDYVAGYELTLPAGSQNFDDIWKQTPAKFDIGRRALGETIAYGPDSNTLYSTSEDKGSPIFEIKRR